MSSLRLLIVEDDPASLELMDEVFTSLKAEVRPIDNSRDAAALVCREKFDGIFLDLEMPAMSGFDLAQRVRESPRNKSTPIVIVTGRDDKATMQQAFAIGATFFLQKPVDRQRLNGLFRAVRGAFVQNKRKSLRVPLQTEVLCQLDSRVIRGTSSNISQGGMQVRADGLNAKDQVHVSFSLPVIGTSIEAFGVVAWVTDGRQGIQFTRVNKQSESAILDFIAHFEDSD
ncbi:MAG: response regulator [Terriglobales bacterium]|jgi:CheY-like chemotaxis protein